MAQTNRTVHIILSGSLGLLILALVVYGWLHRDSCDDPLDRWMWAQAVALFMIIGSLWLPIRPKMRTWCIGISVFLTVFFAIVGIVLLIGDTGCNPEIFQQVMIFVVIIVTIAILFIFMLLGRYTPWMDSLQASVYHTAGATPKPSTGLRLGDDEDENSVHRV